VAAGVSGAWQLGCFVIFGWELAATNQSFWYMQAPGLWLSWCIGALAAEAWSGRTRLPGWLTGWPIFFVALGVGLLDRRFAWSMMIRDTMWAVCCLVVIVKFTGAESARRTWLQVGWTGRVIGALGTVGLFSYSLYLIHQPMLGLARLVGAWLGFAALGMAWTATAALPGILLVSYGWYRLFEKPFMRSARRAIPAETPAHTSRPQPRTAPPLDHAA
jgi:peptidoglycan/LPS O-acetylase OafA/YrhL